MAVQAIDISNYQSQFTDPNTLHVYCQTLDPIPSRIIVRLASYLESDNLRQIAIQQLQAAAKAQFEVQAYGWVYSQSKPQTEASYWNQQVLDSGIPFLDTLWLDVEDHESIPTPEQLVELSNQLINLGYKPGIYTGKYYWEDQMNNSSSCNHLPIWVANYSTAYTLDTVPVPSPWSKATGWQYTSDPLDQNVFNQ